MNKLEDIFKFPIKKDNGFYIGTKSNNCKIDFCNEEKICKEMNYAKLYFPLERNDKDANFLSS